MGKDFVEIKIDTARMKNGAAVAERLRKGKRGGIPWIVILDAEGRELVNSNGPKGNCGYPVQPEEIAWFMKMIGKTASNMNEGDINTVETSLKEIADKILAGRKRGN